MNANLNRLDAFDVVGIAVRTSNQQEMGPGGKIPQAWAQLFRGQILDRIPGKIDGNIIAVYCDYESDKDGAYTYLLGARVAPGTAVPGDLSYWRVPAGSYAVFTTERGAMPQVLIDTWMHIWNLDPTQPGGNRAYQADFELYDERSRDPNDAQVDVYIGVR